jgi:hypothetical protein
MRPRFLPEGWPDRTGWRLPVRPERVDGPWGAFFDIVACAQLGDFSHGDALIQLARDHSEELHSSHVAELVGAIATQTQLRGMFDLIGTGRSFFVSVIANASHWLDFAEACIANRFDSELRPLFFSEFLEAYELPDRESIELAGPYVAYFDRVRARIAELRAQHPRCAYFAYGAPLHPATYVEHIRRFASLDDDGFWEASASISKALFRIETLTGARIAPVDDRAALTAVLAGLEQLDLSSYQPGRRTFHGFAVPD